ncbi:MAG TPA: guanylate kinase [Bacteroidales bacterium]
MEGKLVIISAPSGAGKTTIVKHLLDGGLKLSFSVSATTRQRRGNEIDGVDYFFISVPEFKKRIENNEFVEWEEVYKDLLYGTLKSEIERIWAKGNHVIFDVDVHGGIRLKEIFGNKSIAIFIMPPTIEELENRLLKRNTESSEHLKMRVAKAKQEMSLAEEFDMVIVNHQLDKAKEESLKLVSSFLVGNFK